MDFVALLLLFLILGALTFVHELGHFITAKKFGAYVYEFAIGMGPKIFGFKRNKKGDPTEYSLRALPIGGFCAIAGEVDENDGMDVKIEKDEYMCNKPIWQRCIILIAGVTMNFITGFVILFLMALIWGSTDSKSFIGQVEDGYPMKEAGVARGDRILKIDGQNAKTWDDITLLLSLKHEDTKYIFTIEKSDGRILDITVEPLIKKNENGEETRTFGFGPDTTKHYGLGASLKYAATKFTSIISSMFAIIYNIFAGRISLNSFSGPVGIYSIVGEASRTSVASVLYLAAYLSINLGFMNILPFPAFDGGRVLFLIIEGIRRKKMNPKIENAINGIGFAILMVLMIIVTIKDILKLF